MNKYNLVNGETTEIKENGGNIQIETTQVVVNTIDNQTISGIKTFNDVPICSIAPTNDNQLSNKFYVDTSIENAIGIVLGGSF